nr:MAG TPA: hypothetical protein [Caudoviricetes sp.]
MAFDETHAIMLAHWLKKGFFNMCTANQIYVVQTAVC